LGAGIVKVHVIWIVRTIVMFVMMLLMFAGPCYISKCVNKHLQLLYCLSHTSHLKLTPVQPENSWQMTQHLNMKICSPRTKTCKYNAQ
jgi:hypothetical protein